MSQNINSLPMKTGNTGQFLQIIIIFLVFVVLIIFQNYTQKKQDAQRKSMLDQIKVGDLIETRGGIIGYVTFISENREMVEITTGLDNGTKISININTIYTVKQ